MRSDSGLLVLVHGSRSEDIDAGTGNIGDDDIADFDRRGDFRGMDLIHDGKDLFFRDRSGGDDRKLMIMTAGDRNSRCQHSGRRLDLGLTVDLASGAGVAGDIDSFTIDDVVGDRAAPRTNDTG